MIPNKTLIQPPRASGLIPPDNRASTNLTDWELGGIGLSDPSQGLETSFWYLEVLESGVNTYIQVSIPPATPTILFARPNIIWARLSFDQNMHPVICFIDQTGPYYWWYDPLIPGQTFTAFTSDVTNPCCSMDDKRPLETRLGANDVILAYVRNNSLFYRQQRDRYGTEYLLYQNINTIIPSPTVYKIGMGAGYRLQFEIAGSLYT